MSTDRIERRLLLLGATFMLLYSLALSISPAGWTRSWQVTYRWDHWLGMAVWLGMFSLAHYRARRMLPSRDPYLLPVAAMLVGWGMLTVWRLIPEYGMRQAAWLFIGAGLLTAGMSLPGDLAFLRRYKYLWLSGALALTAATLLFGINPLGYGPRMWLGCCGLYIQPSEPLKLLLIAYLAAYMAGLQPFIVLANAPIPSRPLSTAALLPLIAPTMIMTGLEMVILVVQRDLGTAAIFFFLYAAVVYLASGKRRVLVAAGVGVFIAGLLGYFLFDVVRVRVEAWLNPWLDPSGRSYQIVQSLISIANGGLIGRGPGMGSPSLVPLAHSDLVFSALSEETGLLGVVGVILLFAMLTVRGLRAALNARDHYHRYLAAGLTALIAGQGFLIIAGTLRLLPLTGVTLPFMSYGGSSLVTMFICLLLLLLVSNRSELFPVPLYRPAPYLQLGGFLLVSFAAAAVMAMWWVLPRGEALLGRTDNQRRAIADRYVQRGAILDRNNFPINQSTGEIGELKRLIEYPPLSNVTGYTNSTYGQAGLEASLDDYLRGFRGNPGLTIWLDHLLYGQPPPGLDVRLTLDLDLQRQVDDLLDKHSGAVVAMDASTGEILAMASHPTFDANQLDQQWEFLVNDPDSPLLNRATMGQYPAGEVEKLFPGGFDTLQFNPPPPLRMAQAAGSTGEADTPGGYSPLQMALAGAAISSGGVRPAPQIVAAVNTNLGGWIPLSPLASSVQALDPAQARQVALQNTFPDLPLWGKVAQAAPATDDTLTWFLGGTLPGEGDTPYSVVVALEEDNPVLAKEIGLSILRKLTGIGDE